MMWTSANAGFFVKDGELYECDGTKFVIKGINHTHAWFNDKLENTLIDISKTHANTVRIALSNGEYWGETSIDNVANVVQTAKKNNLITIFQL